MRTLRTAWATAAVAIVTAGAVAAVPAGAAAEPERAHAVCQSRACLVVLDWRNDTDGDGVADVDEAVLDTDPGDGRSVPDAATVLDLMIARKLPSFERHFTEVVVLPTLTPDGSALATGLGEFNLRDGDAKLLKSIGVVIDEVGRNGFDAIMGLRVGVSKDVPTFPFGQSPLSASGGIGPDQGPSEEEMRFSLWMIANDLSLYSRGKPPAGTDLGYNAGKPVAETGKPTNESTGSGVTKTQDITYQDGSRDQVVTSLSVGQNGMSKNQSVTSYGPDGSITGVGYQNTTSRNEPDGSVVHIVEGSRPVRDANGKIIGTRMIEARAVEKKDGTSSGTVTITTTYNNGEQTVVRGKVTDDPEPDCDSDCQDEIDNEIGTDDYGDPEYIGFDVITPEDIARVEFRLKQVGQPGPDDGSTGEHEPDSGTFGQCWPNCTGDPLVVLMDPDGVAVFAAGGEPNFNRWVQPDYDPVLQEMAGLANQKVPATGDDNPNTDGS